MGSFSNSMQKTANKLLSKYGNNISILHKTNLVYQPTQGEYTYDLAEYPLKGSVVNYNAGEIDNTNILTDDLRVTIQTDLYITATDENETYQVSYLGKVWKIVNVERVSTQDANILSILQVRSV